MNTQTRLHVLEMYLLSFIKLIWCDLCLRNIGTQLQIINTVDLFCARLLNSSEILFIDLEGVPEINLYHGDVKYCSDFDFITKYCNRLGESFRRSHNGHEFLLQTIRNVSIKTGHVGVLSNV